MPPKDSHSKGSGKQPNQPKRITVRALKRRQRVQVIPDAPLVVQRVTRHGLSGPPLTTYREDLSLYVLVG